MYCQTPDLGLLVDFNFSQDNNNNNNKNNNNNNNNESPV